MAHITVVVFYENIPRILPENLDVILDSDKFPKLNFVNFIKDTGKVDNRELYRVFNMGIGFILIANNEDSNLIIKLLNETGDRAHIIGKVVNGSNNVKIKGIDF